MSSCLRGEDAVLVGNDQDRLPAAGIALLVRTLHKLGGGDAALFTPIPGLEELTPAAHDARPGTAASTIAGLNERIGIWLAGTDGIPAEERLVLSGQEWHLLLVEARSPAGRRIGALALARTDGDPEPWTSVDRAALGALAALCGACTGTGVVDAGRARQPALDALVTRVASHLMSVSATTLDRSLQWVLQVLTEFFDVDTSFIRRNDRDRKLSVLRAEWPRRKNVPVPDPLGEVPFGVDPIFDATLDLDAPFVITPSESPDSYQQRVREGSGIAEVSMAMVPLVQSSVTVGVLGFVKFGDRPWDESEINALRAVAALIVQLESRVDAEEQLQHQAYHDQLTGLPNRRAFLEELEARMTGTPHGQHALLFIDLDRFKSMNDSLGHGAGDQILVSIADRLRAGTQPGDFVARLAGDEFVVLLEGQDPSRNAVRVADELRILLARPVQVGGQQVSRTASVGISYGIGETLPDDLLAHADAALHRAKAAGGNQVVVFDHVLQASFRDQSDLEIGLRNAIDGGGLLLHYQPEFDLRTGQVLALEALVRWNHPERGLLEAGSFIKVAEEAGLIVSLGQWVLSEAVRQVARWRQQHPQSRFVMRINISPAQLAAGNIVSLLRDCLTLHGVPGNALCLEITEHAVMRDVERSLETLHELKCLGVSLAIDDFGTGYSSMSQLKRLPVNILKIDQTFVAGLGRDVGDSAIIDATVRLAQSFGLEVVAEGVESPDTVRQLLSLGCHRAQGYLLCRPKPPAELDSLLRDRHDRAVIPGSTCDRA